MNILTYHDDIGKPKQAQLIKMWEQTWKSQGFNPIVLSRNDVKDDAYFNEFTEQLHYIHNEILECPVKPYGLTCYYRWLAYARVMNEPGFVCDHDIINFNFPVDYAREVLNENRDVLKFYHGTTPCFVSGPPNMFRKFCKDIIDITKKNLHLLRSTIGPHYNDQEFITYNRTDIFNQRSYVMETCHHEHRLVYDYVHAPHILNKSLIHMSHASIDEQTRDKRVDNMNIETARCIVIKNLLNLKDTFTTPISS